MAALQQPQLGAPQAHKTVGAQRLDPVAPQQGRADQPAAAPRLAPAKPPPQVGRQTPGQQRQRQLRGKPEGVAAAVAGGGQQARPAPAQEQMRMVPAAAERGAFVAAPAGKQHPDAPLRGAELHGLLVGVDMRSRPGAVAPQHGDPVVRAQGAVERLQPLLFANGVNERVFPGLGAARPRPADARQPTEGQRRRAAPAALFAPRQHGDAGGVQAAAQMHPHGAGAWQARLHGAPAEV